MSSSLASPVAVAPDATHRVIAFRRVATRLLLIEQWALLLPISLTAYYAGNSWIGVLLVGGLFHAATSAARLVDPIGLPTRTLIAMGLLLDILLLIYALTGTGSWQMDGGHMWAFAIWSHCLALLCWRSLVVSGSLGVLHHFVLTYLFPLWVFPDGANIWRVLLHGAVIGAEMVALSIFVLLITRMLQNAETLERSLDDSQKRANEANQAKSSFLAFMSHELRTPLNAIIGFSESTKRQIVGPVPGRYLEYAGHIHDSGRHLLALIDDILDLSKIESGAIELDETVVDVAKLVKYCELMVDGRARNSNIALSVACPQSGLRLNADERAAKQVLLNLLSNAIKYSPAGGRVELKVEVDEAGLRFIVADTGYGISADAMARVFEPFQRGDPNVRRKVEGTGLGLAISRKIMLLHGGTLVLTSTEGRGTTAVAAFPLSRVVDSDSPRPPDEERAPPNEKKQIAVSGD